MDKKKRGKSSSIKKYAYWIIIIAALYVLTSANVDNGMIEVEKDVGEDEKLVIVEKLVNVTKYKEEKTPFGTPRCMQFVYNFTKEYAYSEKFDDGKTATCTFLVKNEEDIPGNFTFYAQFIKNTGITEGNDITKHIEAFGTQLFEWNFTLQDDETGSCMLRSNNHPHRMRCFFLQPITYEIKTVPYTEEVLKNVTEYTTMIKENVTKKIYTNRVFGYRQFLYFGY